MFASYINRLFTGVFVLLFVLGNLMAQRNDEVVKIYQKVSRSAVAIEVEYPDPDQTKEAHTFCGGGVVIHAGKGFSLILTADHVVSGAKQPNAKLTIYDYENNDYTGTLVWEAGPPDQDLAVIRIPANLPEAQMDVGDPIIPEYVFTIGEPKFFEHSFADGRVSNLDRDIKSSTDHLHHLVQVSIVANHGNSGGPVFNLDGKLMGIMYASVDPGVTFVIPAKLIDPLLAEGLAAKAIHHGLTVVPIILNVEGDERQQLVVTAADGPAIKAGFVIGDIIKKIAGHKVSDRWDLERSFSDKKGGDEIEVEVLHYGAPRVTTLRLEAPSAQPKAAEHKP